MSAALAVLCFVMIGFGAVKVGDAAETRDRGCEAVKNLENKRENYIKLDEELKASPVDYEAVTAEQAQRQEKYDKDNSRHRADLAEYTATKGGTEMGSLALDEAAYAIQVGRKQYEAGLKELNDKLGNYAFLLDHIPTEEELSGVKMLIDQAQSDYDRAKNRYDEFQTKVNSLRDEGISEVNLAELREMAAELYDEKEELEYRKQEYETLVEASKANVDMLNNLLAELEADENVPRDEINSKIGELMGKTPEEIMSELEFDTEELGKIQASIDELDRRIVEADGKIEDVSVTLDEVQRNLDDARTVYEDAAAKLAELRDLYDKIIMASKARDMMAEAEYALEMGQIEVDTAWYKLQQTKAGFAETEERLMTEKEQLAQDHIELSEVERTVEEYDDLTARHKAARTALILYPEIKSRVEAGEDIAESAEAVRISMAENTEREFKGRMTIYILCVLAGVFGLLTLPEAFEKVKTYPMLTVFAVLCFLCAAAAEVLGIYLGWGQTYAALAGAIFALLLIAVGGKDKIAAA